MYDHQRNTPSFVTRLTSRIQYFSDNCTLQGIDNVFTLKPISLFRRFFWLITITASCVCSAIVLRGVLNLYTSVAVSYSVETDYLEWETPFPAITICEQVDNDRIKEYLAQHDLPTSLIDFARDVTYWNVKYCKSCVNCKKGSTCIEEFVEMVDGIRMKCSQLMTSCWWDDKPFRCCDRFRPILTEYGTCFVFNSRLTGNDSIITVNRRTGLPKLIISTIDDVSIKIHAPDDMVSAAMESIMGRCTILPLVSDFDVELKAEQTTSDVSVEPIAPGSRDCLFDDERPVFADLWPFPLYSYSACVLYTRALLQAEACNCTHHFMPQLRNYPKCSLEGLVCLHKKLKNKDASNVYNCPMACEEMTYKVVHVSCSRHNGKVSEELVKRGNRGQMYLGSLPSLRVRRHAIRELLGLVVDIGGVIGVFFGASLLSFIEIIYLLLFRKVS